MISYGVALTTIKELALSCFLPYLGDGVTGIFWAAGFQFWWSPAYLNPPLVGFSRLSYSPRPPLVNKQLAWLNFYHVKFS